MKRIFAFLLALVMMLGMFPATTRYVYAEEPDEELLLEEEILPEETIAPITEATEPATTVSATEETVPEIMNKEEASPADARGKITYTLTDGVLTISGTGPMNDYTAVLTAPWYARSASVTKVVIKNGITHIGDYAFITCSNLTSITIPESVTSIGDYVFRNCASLTSITIPASVTSIGNSAFRYCSNLRSIEIPDSVTDIGDYAFYGCTSLTNVTIPDRITSIGEGMFTGCCLTSITIPDRVTSIGWNAFNCCSYLTSITIPVGVTYVGDYAFYGCKSLSDVYYKGTQKQWNAISFQPGNDCLTNATIHFAEKRLTITQQPKSVCVDKGETAKVTVKATGDGLKYQWYYKNSGADKFTKSSTTSASYSVKMSDAVAGRKVYCVVKDKYNNTVKTNVVTLDQSVTIKTQPKTVCVDKGETAKVTVKASGVGLTYKWYYKNADASSYSLSSKSTGTSYSVKMSDAVAGRKVYCVVKDKYNNTVKTNVVTLDQSVTIKTQPRTVCVDKGETAKVTVKAKGTGLTYKWYYKNANASSYSLSSKSTGASYSVKMSDAVSGRKVYCVVKDKYNNTVKTNVVTLNQSVTIKTQPKNTCVAKGSTAKVTVKAAGKGLTYQWYYKNPTATKFSKSSATGASYSVKMSNAVSGRQVYCVIKDSYGNTVKSKVVSLDQKVTIITQPKGTSVRETETARVTVEAIGKDLTYKWYYKNPGTESKFTLATNMTGKTFAMPMVAQHSGRQVYCVIKDSYGNSVKTNTVTLKVIF